VSETWREVMLQGDEHEKCIVEKCTNVARYMRWYGKKSRPQRNDLVVCLCTPHRNSGT